MNYHIIDESYPYDGDTKYEYEYILRCIDMIA